MRILIVEDDRLLAAGLAMIVESAGHEVGNGPWSEKLPELSLPVPWLARANVLGLLFWVLASREMHSR